MPRSAVYSLDISIFRLLLFGYLKFVIVVAGGFGVIGHEGNEFILGALIDPTFGPTLMCGAGGLLTELYKDVCFRLIPLDKKEAERMLLELTISEVLHGYRGSRMDLEGLAEILSKLGELVVELGEHFDQLDINPIVFDGERGVALDAVFILN